MPVMTLPLRPFVLVSLLFAGPVAFMAYHWPAAPRAVVRSDFWCWQLEFSGDSTMLALLDRDAGLNAPGQVLVWDVPSGELVQRFRYGTRVYPSRVAFAPDGQTLGLVDAGSVAKWDLGTGELIGEYDQAAWSHDPNHYPGREVLFSETGRWLLHDVYDGRVYDVESGQIVHDYAGRWKDRNHEVHGGCVAALVNGEVTTFDVLSGAEAGTFPAAVQAGQMAGAAMTFSADGGCGVLFVNTGRWAVCDGASGRQVPLDIDPAAALETCCLSGDQRFVAVSLTNPPDNPVEAFHSRLLGETQHTHVFDTASGAQAGRAIRGGLLCRFSPDGKWLAVANADGDVALYDWPPPSRWPQVVTLAAFALLPAWGICYCWNRRRSTRRIER